MCMSRYGLMRALGCKLDTCIHMTERLYFDLASPAQTHAAGDRAFAMGVGT